MTEDNAGSKLTLSGKSTLTLKNLGSKKPEGSKVVQVEVRKNALSARHRPPQLPRLKLTKQPQPS